MSRQSVARADKVYWWAFISYRRGGSIIRAKTERHARSLAAKHKGIDLTETLSLSSHLTIRGVVYKVYGLRAGDTSFSGDPFRLLTSTGFTILDEVTSKPRHYTPRR